MITKLQSICGRGLKPRKLTKICVIVFGILFLLIYTTTSPKGDSHSETDQTRPASTRYAQRTPSRDGIGKIYMGREISQVMGHLAAGWLERPAREREEMPNKLIEMLKLKEGDVVADIGVGTGYIARRISPIVGKTGTIYGVEIQQEMLDILAEKMAEEGITNIKGVLGTITDPKLPPNLVDLAIMVDVYHEFSHPYEMMHNICRALKVGGRVAFVEYRLEDDNVPIKRLHKMSELQVVKEATPHPLSWVETHDDLPWQHVIIFEKVAGE
ncbi:class I SAM-dependent methyltransferase [Candidatus Poribacteria bacterium]|nr:class I SAM-dependent methyltransferase [Candidatus Poribacteria bacterium]